MDATTSLALENLYRTIDVAHRAVLDHRKPDTQAPWDGHATLEGMSEALRAALLNHGEDNEALREIICELEARVAASMALYAISSGSVEPLS